MLKFSSLLPYIHWNSFSALLPWCSDPLLQLQTGFEHSNAQSHNPNNLLSISQTPRPSVRNFWPCPTVIPLICISPVYLVYQTLLGLGAWLPFLLPDYATESCMIFSLSRIDCARLAAFQKLLTCFVFPLFPSPTSHLLSPPSLRFWTRPAWR